MRKINLKELTFNDPEIPTGTKLNYGAQLQTVMKYAPNGMQHSEMIDILPVYGKIRAASEKKKPFVLLEEQEFNLIVTKVQRYPFPMFSETFATFCSDIINAEQVEAKIA